MSEMNTRIVENSRGGVDYFMKNDCTVKELGSNTYTTNEFDEDNQSMKEEKCTVYGVIKDEYSLFEFMVYNDPDIVLTTNEVKELIKTQVQEKYSYYLRNENE